MTHIVGGGGSCYLRHYDALRTKIDMWLTTYLHFCQISNRTNCSFKAITWPLQNFIFKKTKFLLLSSKCIFKAPLNGFYNLEPMINVLCIFVEYEEYECGKCRIWITVLRHVTLVKLLIFQKSFSRLSSNYIFKVFLYGQ